MNNFNLFWRSTIYSFIFACFAIWLASFAVDKLQPTWQCTAIEKKIARKIPSGITFDRVSLLFWLSRCSDRVDGVFISSSEGSGDLSFGSLAASDGYNFDQLLSAHRGVKSFGYISSFNIHPERKDQLKTIVLLNPVYFSFGAKTDSAAIRLSAISTLSFVTQIPTLSIKFDEYIPLSTFIGSKEMLKELSHIRRANRNELPTNIKSVPPISIPESYDLQYNMLPESVKSYGNYQSVFDPQKEPTIELLKTQAKAIVRNNVPSSCVVLLPVNEILLQQNKRDTAAVREDLLKAFSLVPAENQINLLDLGQLPYVFKDSMHFTDYGKLLVWKNIKKSDCFRRYFETLNASTYKRQHE